MKFNAVAQGENPAGVVAVVDLPFAGKARGKPGDSLRMGEIPVDQPVEGGKAAKSKTFAAIIWDTRGRWRVGRGHRDPQGLPERGWRRDGQQEAGGKGGEEASAQHGAPRSKREMVIRLRGFPPPVWVQSACRHRRRGLYRCAPIA